MQPFIFKSATPDMGKCRQSVSSHTGWQGYHQCSRKAVVDWQNAEGETLGLCKQHHPSNVAKRDRERSEAYEAKRRKKQDARSGWKRPYVTPDNHQECLVRLEGGTVIAMWREFSGCWYRLTQLEDPTIWATIRHEDVTAWAPLPPPPTWEE